MSIFLALGGMVQESRIPFEPTASPSRLIGGLGTGEGERICVEERRGEERKEDIFSLITTFVHYN